LPFIEGDELHPKHNVDKMSRGEPLTDADREPWLKLIRKRAEEVCHQQWEECKVWVQTNVQDTESGCMGRGDDVEKRSKPRGVVVSCSALRRSYRETLRGSKQSSEESHPSETSIKLHDLALYELVTTFVFLNGPKEVLEERMSNRQGHFMKQVMLESQLDTLEDPTKTGEEGVIEIDIQLDPEKQLTEVLHGLTLRMEEHP
jgi:gluconokinase